MATPSQTAALRQEGSTSELCSLRARQPPATGRTSQGAALCCPVSGASAPSPGLSVSVYSVPFSPLTAWQELFKGGRKRAQQLKQQ